MNTGKNIFWAVPFIVVGTVWILKNTGMISYDIFRLIVSWQMLIMYIGLGSISRRHYVGGLITFLVGAAFLLPELGWLDSNWLHVYWPVALVTVGLLIIFEPRRRNTEHWNSRGGDRDTAKETAGAAKSSFINTEGYVESDNTLGSVEQIILDPVFKGARIRVLFGGTVLDLRRTKLESPKTYIDIDCRFAGVEIYTPNDWRIHFNACPIMGGCEDKRFNTSLELDMEHVLVVRGNVTFGGIEIKS